MLSEFRKSAELQLSAAELPQMHGQSEASHLGCVLEPRFIGAPIPRQHIRSMIHLRIGTISGILVDMLQVREILCPILEEDGLKDDVIFDILLLFYSPRVGSCCRGEKVP
eukprot:Gb_40348 [translate_table: standard]